jgi:hypothetical protein
MSANNWMRCPKCSQTADQKLEKLQQQYGKVSAQEYQALLQDYNEHNDDYEETLREDWELGLHTQCDKVGVFFVDYCCSCDRCGFKFSYEKEIDVLSDKCGDNR